MPEVEPGAYPLYSPRQLPELVGDDIVLTWDQEDADSIISHGDRLVWREWTGWEVYDRFEEICVVLKHKFGSRLRDIIPTPRSEYALFGDSSAAAFHISAARESLAKVPIVEPFYWLSLEEAVRLGNRAMIQAYLAQGGDPNMESIVRGSGVTLLHVAARRRQPEIALMLIASGSNVNAVNTLGKPPLVDALDDYFLPRPPPGPLGPLPPEILQSESTTRIVKMLIGAGANLSGLNQPFSETHGLPREMYQSPINLAARNGYVDALRILLDLGVDVDSPDIYGDTPLINALIHRQTESARILIDAGADVNRRRFDPFQVGDTPVLMVVKNNLFALEQKLDLVREMARAGADMNVTNKLGESVLLAAIRLGMDQRPAIMGFSTKDEAYKEQVVRIPVEQKAAPADVALLVRVLVAAGSDTDAKDLDGKTALMLAVEGGLTELIPLLGGS